MACGGGCLNRSGESPDTPERFKVFGMVMMHFDEFAVIPQRIHDAGGQIIVEGRVTGSTKTGRKLDAPAAWVWAVHGGKATRNVNYHDTNAWREALGA